MGVAKKVKCAGRKMTKKELASIAYKYARYDSFVETFPLMMEEARDRYAEKHPDCDFLWAEADGSLIDVTMNIQLDEGMLRRLEAKAKAKKTTVRELIEFFVFNKMRVA